VFLASEETTAKAPVEEAPHKRVLVAFLVRDGEKWLKRFFDCLDRLDYAREDLKFVILEGNSTDNSWIMVVYYTYTHSGVLLTKLDIDDSIGRFRRLAMLKNRVIDLAFKDEDYVLWFDSDLVDFPASLLKDLMKADADIVAPYVLIEGTDRFYDHLAFRKDGIKFMFPEGIPTVPLPSDRFEVDAVGTCMLVKGDVYRKGIRFIESDVESEQVLFCTAAKKCGFKVLADPNLKVFHANLQLYGKLWH
jgi:glycosyltransferase involved in cell wall biosynthesis